MEKTCKRLEHQCVESGSYLNYSLFFSVQLPTAARNATFLLPAIEECVELFSLELISLMHVFMGLCVFVFVFVFFCGLDLTVKQLIFRKTLAISLDESLTQGSAHLQECLTPVFQAPC